MTAWPSRASVQTREREVRPAGRRRRRSVAPCAAPRLRHLAKRFALYEHGPDGETVLRKRSEHGLGALLSPLDPAALDHDKPGRTSWIDLVWERSIDEARGGPVPPEPDWFDRPALSRVACTSPAILGTFATWNAGRPYAQQIKPFNFLLLAQVDALVALPPGFDRNRLTLIAPYETDPARWLSLPWHNRFDGHAVAVTSDPLGSPAAVRIKTYRDVIYEYATHPEAKSAGLDGRVCTRRTRGLLGRLHVTATRVHHIGKESNELEDVQAGAVLVEHDPTLEYGRPDPRAEWEAALPALRALGVGRLAALTEVGTHAPIVAERGPGAACRRP